MIRKCVQYFIIHVFLCFLVGCATSYYSEGRKSLEQEDYESAISYFESALQKNSENVKVLRELGITYYRKIDFENAIPLLIRAFLKDSTDGRTLFYLGTAYEINKEYGFALDIYRRYTDVSRFESIRSSIKTRMARLIRKQMEKNIESVLAQEKSLDVLSVSDSTIAVLNFKNVWGKKEFDPIQKGMADMLITDFSKVRALQVVERMKIQKLLEEIKLGETGLVDNATTPRVGRLLGTSRLVNGSLVHLQNEGLRIDAGLLSIKDSRDMKTERVEGKLAGLFRMEKRLVFKLIDRMSIRLSQEERDAIEIIPTENLLAFLAYCRGLNYEDHGMFREAAIEFNNALKIDPNYEEAQQHLETAESVATEEMTVAELEEFYVQETGGIPPDVQDRLVDSEVTTEEDETVRDPEERTDEDDAVRAQLVHTDETALDDIRILVVDQIIHIGNVLNQGFLPGIESREPAQEQNQPNFGNTANFEFRLPLP